MWAKSRRNKQILQDELAFLVEKASEKPSMGSKIERQLASVGENTVATAQNFG